MHLLVTQFNEAPVLVAGWKDYQANKKSNFSALNKTFVVILKLHRQERKSLEGFIQKWFASQLYLDSNCLIRLHGGQHKLFILKKVLSLYNEQ